MIKSLLKRLRGSENPPPPAPLQALRVVGDVHGRVDLLWRLLEKPTDAQTVLVGDYVDRGEDSAQVLRLLQARDDLICLIGNHEDMMLRFLDDPAKQGQRWLRNGGLQTVASFGVTGVTQTAGADELTRARDALADAMGTGLIDWLRELPAFWQSGNVAVTHAGADPALPMDQQDAKVLRWGHRAFETTPRSDGLWIVHGHTIVDAPVMKNGRICVDTGAYATGRLTAAHITDQGVTFEETT